MTIRCRLDDDDPRCAYAGERPYPATVSNQSSSSQSLFRMYYLALQLEAGMGEIEERAKIMRAENTLPPQSK
ncbi:hypothetical protein [Xenorhabdus bovienii]|uniref:hypothetical protein n=1 Tax=Xenorhabdus bovienii TaxID=40576 RepID=UPI00117FC6BB|nr:hypothetical protein [Xenorhabdus bovienii]